MKKYLLVILAFSGLSALSAQDYEEGEMTMNLGVNNGFALDLPDYDSKFAMSTWRDYLKQFKGKTKKVKRSSELFTDDATISYLSSNTIDIYSKVDKSGGGSELEIWFDLGGAFLSTEVHEEAAEGVGLFLDGFQKKLNVESIKMELASEEKELKSLESKLKKLHSLNERYHREIESWKEKIAANEDKIAVNIQDQADMEGAIEGQKKKVKDVEVKLAKAEN